MRPPASLLTLLLVFVLIEAASAAPRDQERVTPTPGVPGMAVAAYFEGRGDLLSAARSFETIAYQSEGAAAPCWRAARSYWRHAQGLQLMGGESGIGYVERAELLAEMGLARDPECGACALWKYAAMGRLVEARGFVWAARNAREMRVLLERGIAARPSHVDPNGNSTLANLYYASAVFHRMVPEWFWLPMFAGVRGDTERSLREIHQALEMSGDRVDYHVEHGAILLCMGTRKGSDARIEQGKRVLYQSLAMPVRLSTDRVDQTYARQLIDDPDKACAFSRIGYIDVASEGRRVAGR